MTTRKTASMGMPKIEDAATALYDSLIPMMGLPSEIRRARPRTAVMVPSVMMNGGRLPTETPTPLMMPTASPPSMATTSGTKIGYCPWPSMAARMPVNATVEPTDISKPPAMMTNIMPNARIPLMEACFRILTRLAGWMKLGFRQVSTTTSAIKITKMKYSLISAFARLVSFIVLPSFTP